MHQIVACITRAKSVSGCIHKLLPRDNRLSKYVMLQKIINTVTAGGVSVTNLGAEYIYRETDPVHPNITKALDIIDYNIKQCYELAPRVFISDVENCEHVYDTVVYLFKDGAANLEALQARFREMVEAWFDEMARDSNLLTAQVVSLITELTNATYIENLDQFNFKGIVLETLTAKANPWAVRMIEMIVSREDIAEEEVLQYIKDDKNAHVSPYFALQYILHVCHTQVKSDEWALGHLSDYFFKTRLVATKLRSLYAEPAELPFNPATLLYRIVFYMCSRPELKLEAPRFAGAVLRSAGRQAFKDLVWEAQTHGAAALLNDLPRSFTPGVRGVWEECLIENNAGI
ncbi:hypothetical protein PAPHI01_0435 [Pancytospora philotis]|nr:hypothetical protein PAPHI01_0435 [Pancytospora philotis]